MSKLSVVPVGNKICRPFIREVLIASPEPGYRFELIVERTCTKANDSLWKLVFDLFQEGEDGAYQQIVHISFAPEELEEQRGVAVLAHEPVSLEAVRMLREDIHPCAKEVASSANPTPAQIKKLEDSMSRVARISLRTKNSAAAAYA
jgi:hypothetical protein